MTRSVVALGAAAAAAGWAAPALLRGRVLRAGVCPVLAGLGRGGHVALTFDDGPDPEGTPAVLDALDRLGWTATFFMLGSQVQRHPEVAAAVVSAGHEAAVHGFTHRNHLARGPVDVHRDVVSAASVITAATGARPSWFRPPYGVLTAGSLTEALTAGLPAVTYRPIPGHGIANSQILADAGLAPWPRDEAELVDAIRKQAVHRGDPSHVVRNPDTTALVLSLLAERDRAAVPGQDSLPA